MSAALPPCVEDRYRPTELLGRGGMGRVWLARDELLNRDVALKELVLPAGLTDEERSQLQARSLREARAIARLDHPNVVRIFDVAFTDSGPWIVMEYVRSRSLQEIVTDDGPLPPARVAEIGLAILAALRSAHEVGILHRDVKPANVLVGVDGRVVLTDFGLAAVEGDPLLTRTGIVLGTPAFLAPERAFDKPGGAAADLWSLGATLYAAVEGNAPFARSSLMSSLAALTTEPVPPAQRAGPLLPALNGLLAKDPAQRIDASEAGRLLSYAAGRRAASADLRAHAGAAPPAPAEPMPGRNRHRRSRHLVATIVALGALVLATAAFVVVNVRGFLPEGAAAPPPRHVDSTSSSTSPSALPAGWHRYVDRTGFSVAVPDGWIVERRASMVYFTDPDESRVLGIDQNDHPKGDAVADWTEQEATRVDAGDFPDYQRIRIARVPYFLEAADWEFTFTEHDTDVHVMNRGFVTGPDKGYAIYWSTPALDWDENLGNLAVVVDSFVPAQSAGT